MKQKETTKEYTASAVSSHYLYTGNTVKPLAAADMVSSRKLEVGTYEVQVSQDKGYYLSRIPDMTVPSVVYGDTPEFAKRVISTYLKRGCNTGVLLEGEQGSGKTMLAKIVSAAMRELGLPTIVINKAYSGPQFNEFMSTIDTPCMVFFDEFEKTYSRSDDKEAVLTFFDGVFDSNKLIICTVNDKDRLSSHMLNRPGRLYYVMNYNRLNNEVIKEYCEDKLDDKSMIDKIVAISSVYGGFNFDMLQALVAEMNMYNCSAADALKYLNIFPSYTKFKTDTAFVAIGINESGLRVSNMLNTYSPPVSLSNPGVSVGFSHYGDEFYTKVKGIMEKGSVSLNDIHELIEQQVSLYKESGYSRIITNTDLVSVDTETGSSLFEGNGCSVLFVPINAEEHKKIVAKVAENNKDKLKKMEQADGYSNRIAAWDN